MFPETELKPFASTSPSSGTSSAYSEVENQTPISDQQQQEYYTIAQIENLEKQQQSTSLYNYGVPINYPPYGMYFWPPGAPQQDPYYTAATAAAAFPGYPHAHLQSMSEAYNEIEMMQKRNERAKVCRAPYTTKQIQILKERFAKSDRIEIKERRELAKIVNLTDQQIKVWFQNRRFKLRRDAEKEEAKKGAEQFRETVEAPMKEIPQNENVYRTSYSQQNFPQYFEQPSYQNFGNPSAL